MRGAVLVGVLATASCGAATPPAPALPGCGPTRRDCLGGGCWKDQCQSIVLVANTGGVDAMVVDGAPGVPASTVFWIEDDSSRRRVALDGRVMSQSLADPTAKKVLAATAGVGNFTSMTLDGDRVYWSVLGDGGAIQAVPRTGGEVQVLVNHTRGASLSPTRDGPFLYFADGEVQRMPIGGGAPTVVTKEAEAFTFAVDGDFLVWVNWWSRDSLGNPNNDAALMKREGGVQSLLDTLGQHLGAVALDGGFVYWTSSSELKRAARSGGPPTTIAGNSPSGVVLDDRYAYWFARTDVLVTTIMRTEKTGGGPVEEVSSPVTGGVSHLTADDRFLYYVEGSSIVKLAK
jgi:hypothetical protein